MRGIIVLLFLSQLGFIKASPIKQEDNLWNQTMPEDLDKEKYQMVGDMIVKKVRKDQTTFKSQFNLCLTLF